ncbi:ferritin heavy chain [Acrasis kona]|uniref:Ferritin heavy chain n=1 Tax=Acrasis kona TaxID=1008807 RepID=A0AAW2YYW7_9EUKA
MKPERFNDDIFGKSEASADSPVDRGSSGYNKNNKRGLVANDSNANERKGKNGFFNRDGESLHQAQGSWDKDSGNRRERRERDAKRTNSRTNSGDDNKQPQERKKRDVWSNSLVGNDDLSKKEQDRREEFERFRKQHLAANEKNKSSIVITENTNSSEEAKKPQTNTQTTTPTNNNGTDMFMSSDFFSNLTMGDEDTSFSPLSNFGPSTRKTSSLLFGSAKSPSEATNERDLLKDLHLDDHLEKDILGDDALVDAEKLFADILDVDKSMPATPTMAFNQIPDGLFFPTAHNMHHPHAHQPPPHVLDAADLDSIESEFLKSINTNKSKEDITSTPTSTPTSATTFNINKLFNAYPDPQQQQQHYYQPNVMMHIPQHLMNNGHPPYMNMPYNAQFPHHQQQFINPYQQYQLHQQKEQLQQNIPSHPVNSQPTSKPQQPNATTAPITTSQDQSKGRVKRSNSFVPPQIQKNHGKNIDVKSGNKKKEESVTNSKKKSSVSVVAKNVKTNDTNQTLPSSARQQNVPQQEPYSPLQKWFGPNLDMSAHSDPHAHVNQQNHLFDIPQAAMSLEDLEKQFHKV